jgi:hypothetical protein
LPYMNVCMGGGGGGRDILVFSFAKFELLSSDKILSIPSPQN